MSLGNLKEQMVAEQVANSEAVTAIAGMVAQLEHEHLRAACDLADAVGQDHPDELPAPEARQDSLRRLIVAVATGEFGDFWVDELESGEFEAAPPAEWVGMGTDSDEWADEVERLAEWVRQQHEDVDATERELAALACRHKFGVGLEAVESQVVGLNTSTEVQRLLRGNFDAARGIIESATAEIEDDGGEE
jgi:hypothetical protein